MDFIEFPKIARLSRDIVITEKLDGTNAQVLIKPVDGNSIALFTPLTAEESARIDGAVAIVGDYGVWAGSRSRWIQPGKDNYGFAKWVCEHAEELCDALGEGTHFGEWWGQGIQRNYSLTEKRFSLFNTKRWGTHFDHQGRVGPCCVVPTLYEGPMEDHGVMKGLQQAMRKLQTYGSIAAPGFMKPEGVVIYHKASNHLWKKTLEKDEEPKQLVIERLAKMGAMLPLKDGELIIDEWPGATQNAEGGR